MNKKNLVLLIGGIFVLLIYGGFVFAIVTTGNVETANDIGKYSSIAIDSDSIAHISHYDDTSNNLRYCNNTAGSWSCVAVETTDSLGQGTSLAIDSNNIIHISHHDGTNTKLRYCNNSGGSWSCTEIEDGGDETSIAIDSNDKVHISHYEPTNDDLRYCNNTAGSWSCVAVDTTNDMGRENSIAIDSNDKVHISHVDNTFHDLRYCNNTAGSWNCIDVDISADALGHETSIAIDSNDKAHISHYTITDTALRYCNNTAGWSCTEVETTDDVGRYSSIAIDSNDKVHISHYDSAITDALRYCNNTGGSWNCMKLVDVGLTFGDPLGRTLAIKKGRIVDTTSFSSKIYISFYDNTNLRYATISYDTINPNINITHPINNTNWIINTIDVNYTASDNLNDLDSCWYSNDTYSVNTSLESCETNITDVVWSEGQHNVTVWAKDTVGNENSSSVTFFIDTLGPAITIAEPQTKNYANNNSIELNYSVSDVSTVSTCWYKVDLLAPFLNAIPNTTIVDCLNTTFKLPGGDEDYRLTFWTNDSLSNINSTTVTFGIRTIAPAISLDAPSNNEYLNNETNIYFNFTATDVDGLDTCELWGNWTGTWHNNYTWVGPETAVMNHTTQNISGDNLYKCNVWCNDTLDNGGFALNNFTFTLDTTFPNITINSITTTAGSQTFNFNSTEQDLNLDECFYSIFDSTGAIDGISENVSYTCGVGQSHSATTTAYGTFNLTIYAIDLATNENSTTRSFTTSPIIVPPPSGGGVTVIEGVIAIEAVNFTITTTNFRSQMDIVLAKDSVKPRKKQFQIINMGIEPIEIEVICDTQDVNESTKDIDICDYVTFSSTNFTVSPNIEERSLGTFELKTPEDTDFGDVYYFNILAVRKIGEETRYSKLSVKSTVSLWATLIKWSSLPIVGQAVVDGEEPRKIIYPVAPVALTIGFILFLIVFLFLRKIELHILGLFLGLTAGIGSFILFLFIL